MILTRLIRLKEGSHYLGMDRHRFNQEVRPHVTEIKIGKQGIAFGRVDLDHWVKALKEQIKQHQPEPLQLKKCPCTKAMKHPRKRPMRVIHVNNSSIFCIPSNITQSKIRNSSMIKQNELTLTQQTFTLVGDTDGERPLIKRRKEDGT